MEQKERDLFLMTNGNKFRSEHILTINKLLENADSIAVYSADFKSPSTIMIISLLAGQFGIDRYILGDKKMGTVKLALFILMYVSIFFMSFFLTLLRESGNSSGVAVLTIASVAIFVLLILVIIILWIYDVATISGKTKDRNLKLLYRILGYDHGKTEPFCTTPADDSNASQETNV
ncbi:MAG: hypothetical protein K2L01_00320 [Rikenellaceae bacterium]|nr:hypothetical protein [Rikenellaceae bacterium]